MKHFRLIQVARPQPEFSMKKIGQVFEVEEGRLVDTINSLKGLPNPAAADPGYCGPKFIALFEEVK